MRRRLGNLLMLLGAVLVGMALSLFLYNSWDARRAEKSAEQIIGQILQSTEKDSGEQAAGEEKEENAEKESGKEKKLPVQNPSVKTENMKTIEIDGFAYIGYLSIPAISLELPVMDTWSEEGLKISPGRYAGSLYSDDLVIAGHNYRRHFSPIKWLETGTEVDFTDMEQTVWRYQVEEVEELAPEQVKEMVTKTKEDGWDLTLFTCTTSGQSRCVVRCRRIKTN